MEVGEKWMGRLLGRDVSRDVAIINSVSPRISSL
jgi:hypothetical protein